MNKNKTLNIIGILSLILMFLFIYLLLKINILPTFILILSLIITITITVVGILFINLKQKGIKVIGLIFILLSLLINALGSYYLYFTNNLFDKTFKNKTETITTYYVVANSKNKFTKKDIKGNIYYYKDTINIKEAIKKIQKNYSVTSKEVDDIEELFISIKENKNKFMLLDKDTYNIIFSLATNFSKEDFQIIYKFEIKTVSKVEDKEKNSFNIYIGGADFTNSLRDFNMLVTVNLQTKKILLTSIPRDYYIEVASKNGKKDTISYMGPYGIDIIMKSLENLFTTKIDYYIDINTTNLVELVDALGGINYCSTTSFITSHSSVIDTYDDSKGKKVKINIGCQKLNGIETLTVARERKAIGGDRQRQKNCQTIIIAIFEKLKNINTLTNYKEISEKISNFYKTTIPRKIINNGIKEILINGNSWKIELQSVDGTDSRNKVHLTTYEDYVMEPDLTTVNIAKEKIKKVMK